MSAVWISIAAMTVIGFLVKAAGPVALGGRELPPTLQRLVVLLPSALLAALVVVQTFARDDELVLDARAAGVAVAIVAVSLRASMLVVLVAAAATTAGVRALW